MKANLIYIKLILLKNKAIFALCSISICFSHGSRFDGVITKDSDKTRYSICYDVANELLCITIKEVTATI